MPDPTEMLDLHGRVALVTGAGQGVGAETSRSLAAFGATVLVNDFFAERAEAVAAEIHAAGGVAVAAPGDVTDFAGMERIVRGAASDVGVVDVLVNNAGNAGAAGLRGLTARPFWEKDPSEWEPFLQVNLYGVMNCCRAVLPGMIDAGRGGRIVTVISDAGRTGERGMEAYAAAKAGAAGLTRSLAKSTAPFGITANNVAIAVMRTPAVADQLADAERMKKVLRNYVIRRVGEPSDPAAMITFLASGASSWITGQTYPVNGGYSFSL